MSEPKTAAVRADDLLRHLKDLRSGTYEGAQSRSTKEASLVDKVDEAQAYARST